MDRTGHVRGGQDWTCKRWTGQDMLEMDRTGHICTVLSASYISSPVHLIVSCPVLSRTPLICTDLYTSYKRCTGQDTRDRQDSIFNRKLI